MELSEKEEVFVAEITAGAELWFKSTNIDE